METRLSSLILVFLGVVCDFLVFLVESQSQNVPASPASVILSPPPPPPSPPPPSPPPPSPPPPSPPPPSPPPPPPPSPPPPSPPPPSPTDSLLSAPPPSYSPPSSPPPSPTPRPSSQKPSSNGSSNGDERSNSNDAPPSPKNSDRSMNAGKKIGLLFLVMAVILQIGVAGFLVLKRQQLLRIEDRYEHCSS